MLYREIQLPDGRWSVAWEDPSGTFHPPVTTPTISRAWCEQDAEQRNELWLFRWQVENSRSRWPDDGERNDDA